MAAPDSTHSVSLLASTVTSLVVTVVAGFLLFWALYWWQVRPQLRRIKDEITDRNASLAARQAREALDAAKQILAWYPVATSGSNSVGAAHLPLPTADDLDQWARLANDSHLKSLLKIAAVLRSEVADSPQSWDNEKGSRNNHPEVIALAAIHTPGSDDWAEAYEGYLEPIRREWEVRRDKWVLTANALCAAATEMRARAEALLRGLAP